MHRQCSCHGRCGTEINFYGGGILLNRTIRAVVVSDKIRLFLIFHHYVGAVVDVEKSTAEGNAGHFAL
jgi:hypothetical protein